MKNKQLFIFGFVFIALFNGCDNHDAAELERGDIISYNSMEVYSATDIEQIISTYGFPSTFNLSYSVEVVRIIYRTIDPDGNYTKASGAIFVPLGSDNHPLLSMNHGTVTKRDAVASVNPLNSTEGITGLLMASMGYFVCAPDYLGFGESDINHPYFHAQSLATAIIDFIRATENYCSVNSITLNEQLFLSGYSEGGYATLAAQKEIEANYSDEFQLTAVAPMAGPYDFCGTTDSVFQRLSYSYSVYPAFIFTAYDEIYGWDRLDEIFNAPYANIMPSLFDGTKSYVEILNLLPTTLTELLNQNFITDYINGNEIEIKAAIEENTLLDWTPIAPLRFYHGDADQIAPYYNSLTVVNNLKANGGTNIDLITIVGGTHATSGLPAILGLIEWFEGFRNGSFRMQFEMIQ